jgi:hypothetical protein
MNFYFYHHLRNQLRIHGGDDDGQDREGVNLNRKEGVIHSIYWDGGNVEFLSNGKGFTSNYYTPTKKRIQSMY